MLNLSTASDAMATTADALLGGRVRLSQPAVGYRVAIDPVLLAAAVPARAGDRVLELGSGAGAAALCLARRVPDCRITGLEIDPEMVVLARANGRGSGLAERVDFVAGDVLAPPAEISAGGFDHVFANPPTCPRRPPTRRRTRARRQPSSRARPTSPRGSRPCWRWSCARVG